MKTDPRAELPTGTRQAQSLSEVLGQSEHVKDMVEECARELAAINTVIKQELAHRDRLPLVENALEKSAAVENKVHEASRKLSVVNRALEGEVRNRDLIDHQFAAAIEQEEGARYAAFHDVLTGLPNRALFNDRLEHAFALAKRHTWTLAVMFVDLDDFKIINDSYGHDAGDSVLQTIALRLKENTRGDDTVSRHGGDEFLYLLMQVRDDKTTAMVAEKIINAIQTPCNVSVRDLKISLSVKASIGISIFPKDGTTAAALVNSADKAMYGAKQNKSGYSFVQQESPSLNVR